MVLFLLGVETPGSTWIPKPKMPSSSQDSCHYTAYLYLMLLLTTVTIRRKLIEKSSAMKIRIVAV